MHIQLTPEACKAARTNAKLSQARVAIDLGINRTYLSQFESGKYLLNEDLLAKLSDYFIEKSGSSMHASVQNKINSPHLAVVTTDSVNTAQEYEELNSSIAALCSYDLENSKFLGLWIDEDEAERRTNEVILLMARAYYLNENISAPEICTNGASQNKSLVFRYVHKKLFANY